jgi:hypothetical protein
VANVTVFEMPVEVRLEFGAPVGLNDLDAERQAPEDVIDLSGRRTRSRPRGRQEARRERTDDLRLAKAFRHARAR